MVFCVQQLHNELHTEVNSSYREMFSVKLVRVFSVGFVLYVLL